MLPRVAGGILSANNHKGWGSPKKGGLEEEDRQSKTSVTSDNLSLGGDCRIGRQGGGGTIHHYYSKQQQHLNTTRLKYAPFHK